MDEEKIPLIGDFAEDAAVKEEQGGDEPNSEKKHSGFSSKIGFVLAAAGSAVGLGNLWRFPYLAAQYGGGMFLLCYILLAVTFGFCLLVLEIAIGRKTGKGVLGAFSALNKKFKWFGFLCIVVPIIILPYYSVIGGWVLKYLASFAVGSEGLTSASTDASAYFQSFISDAWQPLLFFFVFATATILVVVFGVQKGIERVSKILMPLLAILVVFLAIYAICQPGALAGLKKLFVPDFGDFSYQTLLAALGQLFYSMSLAMAIMITYGSYMKKNADIQKSARQISICDTLFAIFAAMIIIPSIYAVTGGGQEAADMMQNKGTSLMFVVLPQMFNGMTGGRIIAVVFFLLVFFAALTSSISLAEAIVAALREHFHMKRWSACLIVFGIMLVFGALSSLGFGVLSPIQIELGGKAYTILDMFDYLSNYILMPLVAIGTCIIAGYFADTDSLMDEIGMRKRGYRLYYRIMVRYIAPICMAAILISGIFLEL